MTQGAVAAGDATSWRQLRRPMGTSRFIAGDPLRGIGSLLVLVYHAAYGSIAFIFPGLSQGLAAYGALGWFLSPMELAVPMFFTLSAYLIGRPYIHALILGELLPSTGQYTRNRILRIVPAFWVIYAVILIRWGVGPHGTPGDALAVFGFAQIYHYTTAAGPIGQAWTLDAEAAFYVLVPVLAFVLAKLGRPMSPWQRLIAFVTLCGSALLLSIYARAHGPDGAFAGIGWLGSPPSMFCSFAPGLLLAALELPLRPFVAARPGTGRALTWLLATGSLFAVLIYVVLGNQVGTPVLLQDLTGKRVVFEVAAMGFLVAALLVRQWSGRGCPRLLDNPVGRWIGERSLSFYLLHFAVLIEMNPIVRDQSSVWAGFAIYLGFSLPVTCVLTEVVYRFVERPFLQRKRTITQSAAPAAVTADTPVQGARLPVPAGVA